MSKWLLLFTAGFFLSGCFLLAPIPSFDSYLNVINDSSTECFISSDGILVKTLDGFCPTMSAVDQAAREIKALIKFTPAQSFFGSVVIFVPGSMRCNNTIAKGCSSGRVSLVSSKSWDLNKVIKHELAHQAVFIKHGPELRAHANCIFWDAVDRTSEYCDDALNIKR